MSDNTAMFNQTLTLINQTEKLLKELHYDSFADNLKKSIQNIINEQHSIIVCGEFKRGKSSLINALLEQQGLCPVDIDIATSVVSVIRYGEQNKLTRHFGQVGGASSEVVDFYKLAEYATGSKDSGTWLLEIEIPCNILKSGIIFIDTPGVGGLDPRHSFLTSYFIPQADIALFVLDASEPVSETELKFIKDKIILEAKAVVIVLNKIDRVDDVETYIKDVRKKIEDTIKEEYSINNINIVAVSSKLKMEYLISNDDNDILESNFKELEEKISQAVSLSKRKSYLLAVKKTEEILKTALIPLTIQNEQVHNSNNDEIKDMQVRFNARKKKMEEFCGPAATWRTRLIKEVSDLKQNVIYDLQEKSIELANRELKRVVEEEGWNAQLSPVAEKLEEAVSKIAKNIEQIIIDKTESICKELGNEIFVETTDLGKSYFNYTFDREVNVKDMPVFKVVTPILKNSVFSASLLTLGGPLGWMAGTIMFLDGVNSSYEQAKKMHNQELSQALIGDIQKSTIALRRYFESRIKIAEEIMQKAVEAEAERIQIQYKEVSDVLGSMLKQSHEERKANEQFVKKKIQPIEQMIKYFERLEIQLG